MLIPDSLIPDSGDLSLRSDVSPVVACATSPRATAPVKTSSKHARTKAAPPTAQTWDAYAAAYSRRYRAEPVRNAKVNGQLSNLLSRLGADEAPQVAVFYVGLDDPFYVRQMHAVDYLLRDAEKLRTQWATGRRTSAPTGGPMTEEQRAAANAEADAEAKRMLFGGQRSNVVEVTSDGRIAGL